jgi:hypothetical protein
MRYRKLRIAWSAIASILISTLIGSALLQSYITIWHPSSFGPFAELRVILVFAACICTAAIVTIVIPVFAWLERQQRLISLPINFAAGLSLGLLIMLLFLKLTGDSVRVPELIAGSAAGAAGTVSYAQFLSGMPGRFSLRTLLIATTLVAVGLGAIIWITK